ncbi:MAG: hypothetical protein PSV26_16370 [Polaromonas sp.]|uniref:hypothetical protein n=1 Tax=Polaromonas sp. TaxID=1869339 RepID=UPI002489CD5A|nr:hypothetical protein [Polaromonas sp.]MDI1239059.1 hypothetical protein [Polaromonas sp.]
MVQWFCWFFTFVLGSEICTPCNAQSKPELHVRRGRGTSKKGMLMLFLSQEVEFGWPGTVVMPLFNRTRAFTRGTAFANRAHQAP